MPYQCRLVDPPDISAGRTFADFRAGDMYPAKWLLEKHWLDSLSSKYLREHASRRPPLVVILPDGTGFCIDSLAWNKSGYHGDGWTVTGVEPLITLSPSINIVGSYHGWIREGTITDDIEGRAQKHAERWARWSAERGE